MPTASVPAPRVPPFPIYRITVPKYHEMIQKGSKSNPPAYRTSRTYLPGQLIPLVVGGRMIAEVPAQDLLP